MGKTAVVAASLLMATAFAFPQKQPARHAQQPKQVFFRQLDSLQPYLPGNMKESYFALGRKYGLSAKNMLSIQNIVYEIISEPLFAPIFRGNLSEKMVVEKLIENSGRLQTPPGTGKRLDVEKLTSGGVIVLAFQTLPKEEQKELGEAISDYMRKTAKNP